jgi:tetratricopeptide (TPR) repeat protein
LFPQKPEMKKIFVVFLILLAITDARAQLNVNHYIMVGRTRIAIGNYTGAIEYFNIVIKFKPYLPEPYFLRGIAKSQLEDFRGAIFDFDQAIQIKPYYPDAYIYRGMAYYELKDYQKSINDYNSALELDPKNEGVYNNRGIAKIALKDIDGAFADYSKALEINPQSTTALMNRSNANIVKGDTKEAISDLNKAIIIRPHFAGAYLNRGLARFEMNDYASALRDFDQCIKLDPKNALAYNNRGIVKHKLENYAGAIMDYDMAISLDPQQANAYFNRAMAKEILGRPGYESDYSIAAQLNPQYDLSRYQIDAGQLAQNKPGNQQQGQQPAQQNTQNQNQANQQKQNSTQNQPGNTQNNADDKKDKSQSQKKKKLNLVVSDDRNLPNEKEDPDDGLVQNKNIAIELQPVFLITAFEKNNVDYDRLQYYNNILEEMNVENNYNPVLGISNKTNTGYHDIFNNLVLTFNERLAINKNAHNYLNRGIFKTLAGDYNSALDDLNKVIDMDAKNSLAYFTRGNCRYKILEHIESLSDSYKQMPVPLNKPGLIAPMSTPKADSAKSSEDYDLVLEDYSSAVFLNPNFYVAYFNRAYINLLLKNYSSAMDDLNRAISLEPEFAEAYYNRGLTKIFMDDPEGGAIDLSRAGELGLSSAYNVIKRYCN